MAELTLKLTPAQLRAVIAACALYEAEAPESTAGVTLPAQQCAARARLKCWAALDHLPGPPEVDEPDDAELIARALRFSATDAVPGGRGTECFELTERLRMVALAETFEEGDDDADG